MGIAVGITVTRIFVGVNVGLDVVVCVGIYDSSDGEGHLLNDR